MKANTPASRKQLKKKCDDLWGKIIRSRGKCERCGKTTGLQAAHIISRNYGKTRHLLENGVALCSGCHIFWAHKEPDEFVDWIKKTRGEDTFYKLRQIANQDGKVDYEKAYLILKEEAKELNQI